MKHSIELCGGRISRWAGVILFLASHAGLVTAAQVDTDEPSLEAELRAPKTIYQIGQPIPVDFVIRNRTDVPVTLEVAQLRVAEKPPIGQGLPLEHVFSGETGDSIRVRLESDPKPIRYSTPNLAPEAHAIVLAPHATVGTRIDLTRHFEALRRPGTYEIQWRPYLGALQSNVLRITVAPLRQAVIETDFGKMRIRLFYDKAPRHVENFIELVEKGFYDGLTFHRIVHGAFLQGGDPRGDGTGVRPDGKLLKAELSDIPVDAGCVVMATARDDPDSGSCQFYIALTRLRALDGKQTVFGRLADEASFETLRKIASVPTGERDRPIKPVYIRSVSLENVPPEENSRIGQRVTTRSYERETVWRSPGGSASPAQSGDRSSVRPTTRATTQPTRILMNPQGRSGLP